MPAVGIDLLRPAERNARVEVVHLEHELAAVLIVGEEAKAAAAERIAVRQAEREHQALAGRRRPKRTAQQGRPEQRGGAA